MDPQETRACVERVWREAALPALHDFIRIPNQSPLFDPEWERNGHMERAVELVAGWVRGRRIEGLEVEVRRIPGKTPLLLLEASGSGPGTVLLYGHLDKQPPFEGWRADEGFGPWTPVERDGKLYGRGGGDDGYAAFAIVSAVEALKAQGVRHGRLVAVIECSEESGSQDLPAYMDALASRLGTPDLVIGLDSGCGDYERLWNTTSLRGLVAGNLVVSVLTEGVHSGDASGIVPSSFRIARALLDRLEDPATGGIRLPSLSVDIPPMRRTQAAEMARVLGPSLYERLPFLSGTRPAASDLTELLLNRTWRPSLSITGAAGLPTLAQAGNVLRPSTALKLSLRIPPTIDAARATAIVKETLERDPPYGARVAFESEKASPGWEAPPPTAWLSRSLEDASRAFFGKAPCDMGEGGSIPFMHMLGERFPRAQFLITGVLGPHANAHGPNEFLHIGMAQAVTACVAHVLADAVGHSTS